MNEIFKQHELLVTYVLLEINEVEQIFYRPTSTSPDKAYRVTD